MHAADRRRLAVRACLFWAAGWLLAGAALAEAPLPYSTAVAERFATPAARYATPALAPGRTAFTSNDELAAFAARLADGGVVRLVDAGRSHAGVPIVALHFSRGSGRPVALLLGQQHGNEPAGGEALLAVALALADGRGALAAVLDQIDVVIVPRANPDGAQLARRTNAVGLDVNRDHLLLATPEARAIARLAQALAPVLVVDAHEHLALSRHMHALGAVARHDLLLQYATTPNLDPALVHASEAWFRAPLLQALAREGVSADWYYVRTEAERRMAMGGVQPALARNAFGLRHAVSVLLESRGMDLGRLHFERRVHSHVVAVSSLLHSAAEHASALHALQAEAGEAPRRQACDGELVIEAATTSMQRDLLMIDAVTGADRAVTVDWESALALRPVATRRRPCGYWLDATATEAVLRLRGLGVQVRRLEAATSLQVQRYRETARGGPVEAPRPLRLTVTLDGQRQWEAPAGGHYVPMDQPLAALAAAALEPDTAHSYVAHRLLTLDQLARVTQAP